MATDGAILVRDRVVAAAIETTTGTAATLAGADGAMNWYDAKISADIPATDRQQAGTLTAPPAVPGARTGKLSGRTEVYNAATAPLSFSRLLLACGFAASTGVYTPLTGSQTTLTLGVCEGSSARLKTALGCMGNVKISGEYGKPSYFNWDFMGKWAATQTVTKLVPTLPTTVPARTAGITLTIGGVSYKIGKYELDMGNKCILRQDVTDVTGYHSAYITDRKPLFKVPVEALPFGTIDWWANHLAGTTAALNLVIGSGTNGTVTIAAPAMQHYEPPQDEDRDGTMLDSLNFLLTSTTADGELSITLS